MIQKFLVLVFFTLMHFSVMAIERPLGLGVMIGNPTGVNGKYWIDSTRAYDGGVGISPGTDWEGSVHGDYLWHKADFLYFDEIHPLDLYYGLGGRMEFSDSIELGIRTPVGVVWKIPEERAEFFGEAAPIFDFLGNIGVELSFGFGARYYF